MNNLRKEMAKRQFVEWFKKNEPFYYRVALKMDQIKRNKKSVPLNGIGVDWGGLFSSIGTTIKEAVPAALQYRQQKALMKVQLNRAEQGLPPLNVADYSPVVRVAPQITPETEQAITRVAIETTESGMKKALPWIVGGAVAIPLILRAR